MGIKKVFPNCDADAASFIQAVTKLNPLYIHEMTDQIMEHIEKELK